MKNIITLTTVLLTVFYLPTFGQIPATNSGGEVGKVQPKIMVIPYTKEGEDIRTILEEDVNRRIAVTKIKEAFDNRSFTTVDFTAKLKAATQNQLLTSDNKTDWKTQIIQMSGADIYVQSEVSVVAGSYNPECGKASSKVTLILTAYEISSGNSLSNKIGESRYSCGDVGRLASDAVEGIADEFLNVMQSKFDDIVENGVEIIVDFTINQAATYTFDDEFGPDQYPLRDVLSTWIEESAYKNQWDYGADGSLKQTFLLRIPLKDQKTGSNYSASKFATEIMKYLKTLNIPIERTNTSNSINITLK